MWRSRILCRALVALVAAPLKRVGGYGTAGLAGCADHLGTRFPSGLYFLRLSSSEFRSGGVIAVAVEPNAAADDLDVDLGWTSCGLFYAEQNTCPQSELRLGHLAGRVGDAAEASIPDAEILLLDPAGVLLQRTRSDRAGNFASLPLADGAYQLVVRSAGFTPLRRTLTLDSESDGSHLEVLLGVAGLCSDARIR